MITQDEYDTLPFPMCMWDWDVEPVVNYDFELMRSFGIV